MHMWANFAGLLSVWEIDSALVMTRILQFPVHDFIDCSIWPNNGLLALFGPYDVSYDACQLSIYSRLPDGLGDPVTLGDICSAICQRAGFDVSELDTVCAD